jgi:ribosome-binding factor A
MARVNEVLREVLAEAIELEAGSDPRLELLTVTAVRCDPDLRHATVLLASLPGPAGEALAEVRARLQAAIAREVRIKRTPQLSFEADPAVSYGERVESILRELRSSGELPDAQAAEGQGPEVEGPEVGGAQAGGPVSGEVGALGPGPAPPAVPMSQDR